MPKMKTNKSLRKRVKVTATGLIKFQKPGKRHLNAHMTGKRKRQLDRPGVIGGKIAAKYRILLGE